MVTLHNERPKQLKGLQPAMKIKTVDSFYTSVDIYKTEEEQWLYLRARGLTRIKSKWVNVTALRGKHITQAYELMGAVTLDGTRSRSVDIAGAIDFLNKLNLNSREVYELLDLEWGLHKKILRKPAYTLFDPVW